MHLLWLSGVLSECKEAPTITENISSRRSFAPPSPDVPLKLSAEVKYESSVEHPFFSTQLSCSGRLFLSSDSPYGIKKAGDRKNKAHEVIIQTNQSTSSV
ncbi:unnamed protein product [Scytosiphon promiscuus]